MAMPAGTYFIGDLCYVMDKEDWRHVCKHLADFRGGDHSIKATGIFDLPDGRRFAIHSTAWGDGGYYDNHGREYGVDSGTIGCILKEDIRVQCKSRHVVFQRFNKPFITYSDEEGNIYFGSIKIITGDDDEDEEEEEDAQ